MSNSELLARVSRDLALGTNRANLADVAVGSRVKIVAIDPANQASLLPEGIDCGVEVSLERRLALGGPLIIRLGRARLAVSRVVAAGIEVEPTC